MKDTMTKIRALSVEEINKKIADLKAATFDEATRAEFK